LFRTELNDELILKTNYLELNVQFNLVTNVGQSFCTACRGLHVPNSWK